MNELPPHIEDAIAEQEAELTRYVREQTGRDDLVVEHDRTEQLSLLRDPAGARAAAEVGMDRARGAERVQMWKAAAALWLDAAPRGSTVIADDLVQVLGLPDPEAGPASNNVVGAMFSAWSKAGRITFTGQFRRSARVIGHGNMQRVWRIV